MWGASRLRAWLLLLLAAGCGSFGAAEELDAGDASAGDAGAAPCGEIVLVGSNAMTGTSNDNVNGNTLDCHAYASPANAVTARCASLYMVAVPGGGAAVHIGVYAHATDRPGALLARATVASPVVGWNSAPLDAPLDLPGGAGSSASDICRERRA